MAKLKAFSNTALILGIAISFELTGCSTNSRESKVTPAATKTLAILTVDEIQNASNPMQWQMVWVDDFGISEITNPLLEAELETFIKGVQIYTMDIDGRVVTTRASTAGCWAITYDVRRRVVTPARTEEKTQQDGSIGYDVIPANLEAYVDIVSVGGACTYHLKIEGKVYDLNWFEPMNDFISLNFRQAVNRIEGNKLAWVDPNGKIIARFEEPPIQKN